jgi:uncharacterized protein YukE
MPDYGVEEIKAIHGVIDNVGEALIFEHKQLDQLTLQLNKVLKKAVWVSESNTEFNGLMQKYNNHMTELHAELNRLAVALKAANVELMRTDKNVANMFRGRM